MFGNDCEEMGFNKNALCSYYCRLPEGFHKVILSTNIAETSITLPWVKVVVDTGVVKAKSVIII